MCTTWSVATGGLEKDYQNKRYRLPPPPIYRYANNKPVVVPSHTYIYTLTQKYTKEGIICKISLVNVKLTDVDFKWKSANRPRGEYKNIKCKGAFYEAEP